MPRSPDTHVDHLKNLLDQRSARADIRGSFSVISEYSDTPSVYSRPFISPKSSDNSEYQDYPSPAFDIHPHSSMLDLDDDSRSEKFTIDDTGYEDGDDNSTRMSYLGPKMRFHSRAPWELEDDTFEEEVETEEGHRLFQPVFPFRGNDSKSTSSSSSPRPSYTTSRPSGESEIINSQPSYQPGSFYTLAQESVSSFGRSTPPIRKETLRSNFSLDRLRSESSNIDLSPSSSHPSPGGSRLNGRSPPYTSDNDPNEPPIRTITSCKAKGDSIKIEDNVHPYANPDLVVSSSPSRTTYCQQRTSDELDIAPFESPDPNLRRDITANSALPKHRMSFIQPKISSPMPLIGAPYQIETSMAENHLEQNPNTAPTFSLISLEEARAQRIRSATANPTSKKSGAGGMPNPSMFRPIEIATPPGTDSSPAGGSKTRARARSRSISAGANKARSALQSIVGQPKPDRRESEPAIINSQPSVGHPGKTLKHKKSGFMRLFNAGKVPEKDEQATLPSVPSLPDSYSINHAVVQRASKTSIHRIPGSHLSPSFLEFSSAQGHDTLTNDTRSTKHRLSINTQLSPVVGVVSASIMDDRGSQTQSPWKFDQPLQSAPAVVSEFPTLKLRPVSTLFSAHFGDHIVASDSRPSSEIDSTTPRSSSPRAIEPLTPTSATQTCHQPTIFSSPDNQVSVVTSLQLAAAKSALQLHISELEGQVRDLKATVEELKASDNKGYCQSCGRGKEITVEAAVPRSKSVVHRPRARTGTSSRFTNALL